MSSDTETEQDTPWWARGDPLMEWYAKEIWGKQVEDDDLLFEVMSLQIFQAGLNWRMILLKRDAFRNAFDGWKIDSVAGFTPDRVDQMLQDAAIVRNRKKIEACIDNARTIQGIQEQHDSFCNWFYNRLEGDDLPTLQKALRSTFKFIGPEIARMWIFASGRLPATDHDHDHEHQT
jgi:DNA-3-methyladenine glycosylase I